MTLYVIATLGSNLLAIIYVMTLIPTLILPNRAVALEHGLETSRFLPRAHFRIARTTWQAILDKFFRWPSMRYRGAALHAPFKPRQV